MLHPQHDNDLRTLQGLEHRDVDDIAIAELARLHIRYQDFKGAEDIHSFMANLLKQWGLTLEELFTKAQTIHQTRPVYRGDSMRQEDWS